jgi:hypothetical protein
MASGTGASREGQLRYFAVLRELIRGDRATYRRHCAALNACGWDGVDAMIAATFHLVVERSFTTAPRSAVRRFIRQVRAEGAAVGVHVDAGVAAELVAAVLTDKRELMDGLDPRVVVEAELLMVWKLLQPLSDAELAALFEQARAAAQPIRSGGHRVQPRRTAGPPGQGMGRQPSPPAGTAGAGGDGSGQRGRW